MRPTRTAVLTLAASALVLGGCGTMRDSIGLTKVTPDEFLTVSTAPLTVPPEYGLRPPSPGQPRPQELAPESAARQILLGQRQAVTRSPGEQVLVATGFGDRADPLARYVIDDEFGDLPFLFQAFAAPALRPRSASATMATPPMVRAAPVRIWAVSTSPMNSQPIRIETTGVASR